MQVAKLPENERERLFLLEELDILDTPEEGEYDDIAYLAAQVCEAPIALVCLIDKDRQWFKAHYGLDVRETSRDLAYCSHAILSGETLHIKDAEKDLRFQGNPLLDGPPHVKFYCGVPLELKPDLFVGTLCVIDHKSRKLSKEQQLCLKALARQAVAQLQLRLKVKESKLYSKTQRQFFYMLNHEIRTPLVSIEGALSLALSGEIEKGSQVYTDVLTSAQANTKHMGVLITDILELLRLDASDFSVGSTPTNLNQVIRNTQSLLKSYLDRCQVSLVFSLDASLPKVPCDSHLVMQVMNNLISNAAKFSPPGAEIVITSKYNREQHMAVVSVRDHGEGIAPKDQKKLFQAFTKVRSSPYHKIPSSGLGLHLIKLIVEKHGGTVTCDSAVGKGSTFTFSLPLVKENC